MRHLSLYFVWNKPFYCVFKSPILKAPFVLIGYILEASRGEAPCACELYGLYFMKVENVWRLGILGSQKLFELLAHSDYIYIC